MRAVALAAAIVAPAAAAPAAAAERAPTWVVDPAQPGPDLPPTGRSLFDHLIASADGRVDAPFPFDALLGRIARELGDARSGAPIKTVMIPLSRALHREAAAPDYFAFPRAVAAIDAEPAARSPLLLKDRLYLAYQEKGGLLEVISYNEAAGRFEFQVVRGYAPGGTPRVVYANRAICTSCHQNGGPIFSRPLWDETSANEAVAARIRERAAPAYRAHLGGGVDVPNAIDDAVQRANRFPLAQLAWTEGCEGAGGAARRCRAALFEAALAFRLSGRMAPDPAALASRLSPLVAAARARWPDGLAIADPNIANRNPLASARDAAPNVRIDAPIDPLALRAPLAVWTADDAGALAGIVADVGEFLSAADVAALDSALARLRSHHRAVRTTLRARCDVRRSAADAGRADLDFDCEGSREELVAQARVAIAAGRVGDIVIDRLRRGGGAPLLDVAIVDAQSSVASGEARGTPRRGALAARFADADAIERATLRWRGASGEIEIVVVDDSARLAAAIEALLRDAAAGRFDGFDALALRRARLMPALLTALGTPAAERCCLSDHGLPPARTDEVPAAEMPNDGADADAAAVRLLYRHCDACHRTADASPPNFLAGDATTVRAALGECAARIYVRLAMWEQTADRHAKTPMPPAVALLREGTGERAWREGADLATLSAFAARLVERRTGRPPEPASALDRRYDDLPTCVRASAARTANLR